VDHVRTELPGNRTQRKARRPLEAWNYWKKELLMLEGSPGFSPHVLFNAVALNSKLKRYNLYGPIYTAVYENKY
jgi:hypothetical protein